jgi:hypothetical protein
MSKKTGDVTCADVVRYTSAEVQIVVDGGVKVTPAEHRIKKSSAGRLLAMKEEQEQLARENRMRLRAQKIPVTLLRRGRGV